jgi:hypothetical protein
LYYLNVIQVFFHHRAQRSTLSRKMTSKLSYRNKQDTKT